MRICPQCSTPCSKEHQFCPTCGFNLRGSGERDSVDPFIGMTISGKFVTRELIGTGGMGKVYRADQIGVGRTVAVKIMHRHLMGDETAAARFTNEARACSHLNHPNCISVLDFGQTHEAFLYIVYEYLRGRSLDAVLRSEFPIPFGRVAGILCQAMDAVEAAHQLSIIHRDLKPENVFLEQSSGVDFVKVLDFGIAKILDLKDRSITSPGMVPGTPEYMSPEQARGEPLDPRSDVYSLGVILYELLTDSVPFSGSSAVATMMAHVQDPPDPPSRRRPDRKIPERLEAITLHALAKKPEDRVPSAAALRDMLSGWAISAGLWPRRPPTLEAEALVVEERPAEPAVAVDSASAAPLPSLTPRTAASPALGSRDVETPLVGRSEELTRIVAFLGESRAGRTLRICGAAGMGKGRVVAEAVRRAEQEGVTVLHTAPDSGWSASVLGPVRALSLGCLDLPDDAGAEEILQAAGRFGLQADDVPGLQELFGIAGHLAQMDPDSRRRERTAAFLHLIHRAAPANGTMLLVFEELDRFDEASRELVAAAVTTQLEGHVAFLITHTPDYPQLWPPDVAAMDLMPLDDDASRELVRGTVLDGAPPREAAQHVVHIGRGHPLFLEQLAHARIFEGVDDPPDKVADLVAVRVERLPQHERQLLQHIAVVNEEISPRTLARLKGRPVDRTLLDSLVEKRFLKRTRDREAFVFSHNLVAMVVYSSIPAEVRRRIHGRVADHLRRASAPIALVAHHSFEADDGTRAIEELDQAGASALQALDHRFAIANYSRALDMVRREWGKGRVMEEELEQLSVGLARRLATVLLEAGEPQTSRGILEEALSIAAGQGASRAGLRLDLGRIDLEHGNMQRAVRHLELARADATASESDFLLAEVSRELARAIGLQGDGERAGELVLESLDASRRAAGHRREPGWAFLLDLAITCAQVDFHDRARGYLLDALQEAEVARSIPGKLRIIVEMAQVHQRCSEWSEAEIRLSQALDLAVQVGDRTLESTLLIDLGRLRRIQGDVEKARKHLEHAVRRARAVGWWDGIQSAEREIEMLKYAIPQAL